MRPVIGMEWTTRIDDPWERGEDVSRWDPGPNVLTRMDLGWVDPRVFLGLPGARNEDIKLTFPPGRYTPRQWDEFVAGFRRHGWNTELAAPIITKEKDGRVYIYEGNHRIRAAVAAGLLEIPVDIRYFAGSQRGGMLVVDPETGLKGRGWVGRFGSRSR